MYSNNFNRGFLNNYDMYSNYNNYYPNYGIKSNLFSRFNKDSFNIFLNNTSKTLNVINQAIPIVNQVRPLVNNLRTMFVIADIIKDDKPEKEIINNNKPIDRDNQPTFFL